MQLSELQKQLDRVNQERSELQYQMSNLPTEFNPNELELEVPLPLSELQNQLETANMERANIMSIMLDLQMQLDIANQEHIQLTSQQTRQQNPVAKPTSEIRKLELPELEVLPIIEPETPAETEVVKREDLIVSQKGEGDYTTISEAINNANPRTRIYVHPGLYQESLILDKRLEILGVGALEEIIVESEQASCLEMQTDWALVRGITFQETGKHYAVKVGEGVLVIEDSNLIACNYSVMGVFGTKVSSMLSRCQIREGMWNGIFISDGATVTVEDSYIGGNRSAGIGIGKGAKLVIQRCRVTDNGGEGIGVYQGGSAVVEDCDLTENGGGAWRVIDNGSLREKGNQI